MGYLRFALSHGIFYGLLIALAACSSPVSKTDWASMDYSSGYCGQNPSSPACAPRNDDIAAASRGKR